MAIEKGIFGALSNLGDRLYTDYAKLAEVIEACRCIGLRIVLTSGSFDLVHVGHARYLEQAKRNGDLLVVGVDSDAKIKARKGPNRPIVPEAERAEMLSHIRSVDVIVIKPLKDEQWALIKAIRPDVLIASHDTYTPDEICKLEKDYCGSVTILDPMAETSTTEKIRRVHMELGGRISARLVEVLPQIAEKVINEAVEGSI